MKRGPGSADDKRAAGADSCRMGGGLADETQAALGYALRKEDETLERLLLNQGFILQKRHGYRFSIDAVLLAYLAALRRARPRSPGRFGYMDLGCGCGIVPILLARREPGLHGYGVEIQESLADLAERNMRLHGLEDRIRILHEDLKNLPKSFASGSFDWMTCNPPYRPLAAGRVNPDPQKALARHEIAASLAEICAVMAYLLRAGGKAFLIYPAARSVELLSRMRQHALEPKYLRPVYPRVGERAKWVLVEGVRRGRESLLVDIPLYLEEETGGYTEEVRRMFLWHS